MEGWSVGETRLVCADVIELSTSFAATLPDAGGLEPHLQVPPPNTLGRGPQHIRWLASQYLGHRFDLLGSGWVEVRHGMACLGLEGIRVAAGWSARSALRDSTNVANQCESERLRSLIGPDYVPIDWQLDFKSGYRWSESTWYRDIRYGNIRGADVKVPWELGRLQHLPQLALAATLARANGDGARAEPYAREFQDQVLDFIAANPPRFGVQWAMTMDVAIRAANLLLAWDIFRAADVSFDSEFMRVFSRSAFEHGSHIATNLEWSSHLRSNHYLADVVGLLFVAAYLPTSTRTDAWLLFATRELLAEVQRPVPARWRQLRGLHLLPPPLGRDGHLGPRPRPGPAGGSPGRLVRAIRGGAGAGTRPTWSGSGSVASACSW